MSPRVVTRDVVKHFRGSTRHETVRAVNGVSLVIESGTTLGIVGESGSGKSTLGRCLVRLIEPTSGRILYDDVDLATLSAKVMRARRRSIQVVFQDPYDAFNPRMRIGAIIEEPLRLHTRLSSAERRARVAELMEMVALPVALATRHPRELSGGQLQRVCIARALVLEPEFVVLDEPTSSLDLSVRGDILELLEQLKRRLNLTYLLISHDLATIAEHCDHVVVMYLGHIVERGPAKAVFHAPQHPYTQALLAAALPPDPLSKLDRIILEGEQPSPIDLPTGCVFAPRCPVVKAECHIGMPAGRIVGKGHDARCIRIDDGSNVLRRGTLDEPMPEQPVGGPARDACE